ncbi:MAG: hypothetical protein H0X62_04890, partial [Bacteroidetes bacterium]|nr:hypothetical protein [Bacteroidota bacterium]
TIIPTIQEGIAKVQIVLIERWYTWPVPIFEIAETNFNTWWLSKDFSRLNYGLFIDRENFRGRKEALRLKFQTGYTSQYAIQYHIPYLNKKQNLGLEATISYYKNREIVYGTLDNKRLFYNSYDSPARNEFSSRLVFSYRHGFYNSSFLSLKFQSASINDTLAMLSEDYFPNNEASTQFFSLSYRFQRDRRDVKAYPLKGYFFDAEILKLGLGMLNNEPDVLFLKGSASKFWKLRDKWFLATGIKGKYGFTTYQPYYVQRGLGYFNENVRGFEYYVIDGQSWGLGRASLKYELLKPEVYISNSFRNNKFNTMHYAFYLNILADAGYVDDKLYNKLNPLANQLLYSTGIGLDFVSFYDMVLRFEYSVNKLGEKGFFINFTAPL